MMYFTITNKAGRVINVFAETEQRAIELVVQTGHVRKASNATVVREPLPVCSGCFPHEGNAATMISPQRVVIAYTKVAGIQHQLSDRLHHENCGGEMSSISNLILNIPVNHGEITTEGFSQ